MANTRTDTLIMQGSFETEHSWFDRVHDWMARLPNGLQPTHFGEGERVRRGDKNAISNAARFEHFIKRCQGSFFLYGHGFSIYVAKYDNIPSEITLWASQSDLRLCEQGPAFMKFLGDSGASYAFGAAWGEYEARNGYVIKFVDGGQGSGFCGRDFHRYVPGLYWLNYFSEEYIERMSLNIEVLAERLSGTIVSTATGEVLQLYDKPVDWTTKSKVVSAVIDETEQIFSIRDVPIPTDLYKKDMLSPAASPCQEWP